MGTQQLLLIIVGIIITAIGIAVWIQLFGASSTLSNKDALINDINNPAEIGTALLEFGTLAKLTGKQAYYDKPKQALRALFAARSCRI